MFPVVTPSEMAEADAAAIAAGTEEATLVERAGGAVARAARRVLGGTYGRRVVVVAGKGNNGADGVVAARCLAAWGARVDVFVLADGVGSDQLRRALDRADLAVDAMFGTGFRGPLEADGAMAAEAFEAAGVAVLAVDVPSGVDGATGKVAGPAVRASTTLCLAALKPGLLFEPGAGHAGVVSVADIGVDVGSPPVGVVEPADVAAWCPGRRPDDHKWSVGGVFVVAGSSGMTGAANLTSRAALRAGAGVVVCGSPGTTAVRLSGSEVIARTLAATDDGALAERAVDEVLDGLGRFGCLVVGPGLGRAASTVAAVRRLVAEAPIPVLVDADGLNALATGGAELPERRVPTILTPHQGEYEHLSGEQVGDDRIGAARRLAERSGATVLLKGPATVVAAPDGRVAVNPNGGPWLATAGTGDVLSGIVGALTARGTGAFEAAAAGAWLHGAAADAGLRPRRSRNPGLVAGDLIDALPRVLPEG